MFGNVVYRSASERYAVKFHPRAYCQCTQHEKDK